MKEKVILLVEDNPDDEALTLRAFNKNNITNKIIVAHDGEEALDYFFCRGKFSNRNPNELPQVTLLDLKLPKINGVEVLREIRNNEKTKLAPVVILTSSEEDTDINQCYEMGANSYIQKPVDFVQFIEAVKQLGMYWLLLNKLPN